jgi:hypothetical protein
MQHTYKLRERYIPKQLVTYEQSQIIVPHYLWVVLNEILNASKHSL